MVGARLGVLVAISLLFGAVASAQPAATAPPAATPPPAATAPPPPSRPGYHEHDGFFARLGFGLGYGHYHLGDDTSNTVGGGGHLAIGKAIGNNLVVFGEFFDNVVLVSRVRADQGGVPTYDSAIVRFLGLGPGITYYTPSNYYVTATLAMTQTVIDFNPYNMDDEPAESKPGVGGAVGAAHEWWLAGNWGLGVAFRITFTVNEMEELDNEIVTALTSTLGLTVTLN